MRISQNQLKTFSEMAETIALESPDPWKKVGCVGVDYHKNTWLGYNRAGDVREAKFWLDREGRRPFVIHAEIDMLSKAMCAPLLIVITLFPCVHCITALAAFGIKQIYYKEIYDKDLQALEVAKFYGISCSKLKG